MYGNFLDFIYPRSCCICKKHGSYVCPSCKKLFKRNLPECYVCRRLSPEFQTHPDCKNKYSLNKVFVAWEYNELCSSILKQYKYKSTFDISPALSHLFVESLLNSTFKKSLQDTLLIPMPIAHGRLNERGFNQMFSITQEIGKAFNLDVENCLVGRKGMGTHQAQKDKNARLAMEDATFFLKESNISSKYSSLTLVDDVITTGTTLNTLAKILKRNLNIENINALCMFRGHPRF